MNKNNFFVVATLLSLTSCASFVSAKWVYKDPQNRRGIISYSGDGLSGIVDKRREAAFTEIRKFCNSDFSIVKELTTTQKVGSYATASGQETAQANAYGSGSANYFGNTATASGSATAFGTSTSSATAVSTDLFATTIEVAFTCNSLVGETAGISPAVAAAAATTGVVPIAALTNTSLGANQNISSNSSPSSFKDIEESNDLPSATNVPVPEVGKTVPSQPAHAYEQKISALEQRVFLLENQARKSNDFQGYGFVDISIGASSFTPDSLNDGRKELFESVGSGVWEDFNKAYIFEMELGKRIDVSDDMVEISIGYQMFKSETINSKISGISFKESFNANSIFLRGAYLIAFDPTRKLSFGPGVTFGYTNSADYKVDIQENGEGVYIKGEGTGTLFEVFGRARYLIDTNFSASLNAGYRFHKIKDITIVAADIVTVNTEEDIDASGLYAKASVSATF